MVGLDTGLSLVAGEVTSNQMVLICLVVQSGKILADSCAGNLVRSDAGSSPSEKSTKVHVTVDSDLQYPATVYVIVFSGNR